MAAAKIYSCALISYHVAYRDYRLSAFRSPVWTEKMTFQLSRLYDGGPRPSIDSVRRSNIKGDHIHCPDVAGMALQRCPREPQRLARLDFRCCHALAVEVLTSLVGLLSIAGAVCCLLEISLHGEYSTSGRFRVWFLIMSVTVCLDVCRSMVLCGFCTILSAFPCDFATPVGFFLLLRAV